MVPRSDGTDGWQHRCDRGQLLSSHVRPDGSLLVEGFAAREGVYVYRQADGSVVRELVTLDAIRSGAATLGRAPLTLGHPAEDVSPATYQRDVVGDVDGEVSVESGGFVRVRMAVRRADAVAAVQHHDAVELSPGYRARIDPTPGVHPVHGAYDARQIERTTNHLALVSAARGGPEMRVRADAAVATTTIRADSAPVTTGAPAPQEARMTPGVARLLAVLGITARADSDAAGIELSIQALETRRTDAATAETAAATKLATETARADSEKARADAAEAKLLQLQTAETARADAAERTGLDALAKTLGVDPAKHADAKDLRKAIATAHLGELRADADDAYIRAVCDIAAKGSQKGAGRVAGIEAWVPGNAGGGNGGTTGAGVTRSDSTPRKSSRDRYYDSLGLGKKAQDTQGGGR